MSAARFVPGIIFVATAVLVACSDGGPPGSLGSLGEKGEKGDWTRTGSHHAPELAADGGEQSGSNEQRADAGLQDSGAGDALHDEEAKSNAAPSQPDPQSNSPSARQRALAALCDGSPGITFSALAIGGGQPQPGTQVMAENGYNFLIIEGTCQYWALHGLLAHVTTGKLSDADQQGVVDALHLDQWTLNTGSTATRALDGPTYFMLFGRELNALDCTTQPAANGCEKVKTGGADFNPLLASYERKRDELSSKGEPLSGDVRYVLVEDAQSLILDWNKPGAWPLGDPARVAMSQQAAASYMPGQSQVARGSDAQKLQEVWRQFLDGEISGHEPGGSLGIPVQVAGKRYALFVRDSIPLEDARGLILF